MTDLEALIRPSYLAACFADVRRRSRSPGVDGLTPARYEEELDAHLARLSGELRDGTWRPHPLVRLRQPKPQGGVRHLAIPTVEDRIVIEVLRRAIEPEIEAKLSPAAYAYRPRRSARKAVDKLASTIAAGASWVALSDIRDFFDSIDLVRLGAGLDELDCQPQLRSLLDRLLTRHALRPGRGLAQGSALSPALSNLALIPLDTALVSAGHDLIRYCDNLCIPSRSEASAREALSAIERETVALGLELKPAESRIHEISGGFVWLGFRLGSFGRRVSDRAVQSLRKRLDAVEESSPGLPLRELLRPIIRGWAQYFDADLPEDSDLGRYNTVARELLAEHRRQGEADIPASAAEIELEPWDEWDELDEPEPASPSAASRAALTELLAEADQLAAAGSYSAAEALHAQAQELRAAPPPIADPPATSPDWDDEALDTFLGLFCAGQDTHEVAAIRGEAGLRGFSPVERPPSSQDLRAHLEGELALAIRPRLRDGSSAIGVLDVDGNGAETMIAVRAHIQALASVARSWGLEALVEHTGGRGMHLWLPLERRIPATQLAALLGALVEAAGHPAQGVRVERLPAGEDAPELHQQTMTLPLGLHVETAERSELRWADGPRVGVDLCGLFARNANEPDDLELDPLPLKPAVPPRRTLPVLDTPSPCATSSTSSTSSTPEHGRTWTELGAAPARVMRGCVLLRHLADKAKATGHLDHSERLSLLYTLGHLGERGKRAIHEIVGACDNYDKPETARQIARLSGLPIGCRRMREKHLTEGTAPLCKCEFGSVRKYGGYPSPVLHSSSFRRTWRDELRRRRTSEALLAESPPAGIGALDETNQTADPTSTAGVVLRGVPPHEWA